VMATRRRIQPHSDYKPGGQERLPASGEFGSGGRACRASLGRTAEGGCPHI